MTHAIDGNRVFILESAAGRVVQKLYFPRKSRFREGVRAALGIARRLKTSQRAAVRRLTEAAQLRHWREQGFDVPRLIEPAAAGLAPGPYNLFEFVEGDVLLLRVREASGLPLAERRDLLARFAAVWQQRHAAALDGNDPRLLQEHGTLEHVLVAGERFVTFDHEQAFLPGAAVLPLVAKEFASCLRSLLKGCGPEFFEELLDALVSGYGNDALLRRIIEHFTHNPSAFWRQVFRFDRQREFRRGAERGKFAALERLAAHLPA